MILKVNTAISCGVCWKFWFGMHFDDIFIIWMKDNMYADSTIKFHTMNKQIRWANITLPKCSICYCHPIESLNLSVLRVLLWNGILRWASIYQQQFNNCAMMKNVSTKLFGMESKTASRIIPRSDQKLSSNAVMIADHCFKGKLSVEFNQTVFTPMSWLKQEISVVLQLF